MAVKVKCSNCGHIYLLYGRKRGTKGTKYRVAPGTLGVKSCSQCTEQFDDNVLKEILEDYNNDRLFAKLKCDACNKVLYQQYKNCPFCGRPLTIQNEMVRIR